MMFHPQIIHIARKIKRALLTEGKALPVYNFFRDIEDIRQPLSVLKDGEYVINLSFDLEHSISTYFWNGDFKHAERVGRKSKTWVQPTLTFLSKRKIPANIQILGLLLSAEGLPRLSCSSEQLHFLEDYPELVILDDSERKCLQNELFELGIHAYSHKLFSDISSDEAVYEIEKTRELILNMGAHQKDLSSDVFMSFPRNVVAHTDLLKDHGVYAYRTRTQIVTAKNQIPKGVWFSSSILDETVFADLLDHIRKHKSNYLLHLWGHFTEMEPEMLERMVTIAEAKGWEFKNVRDVLSNHT